MKQGKLRGLEDPIKLGKIKAAEKGFKKAGILAAFAIIALSILPKRAE